MVIARPKSEPRFNVLLTEDRPHPESHWTRQLPRLLQPQGVQSYVAHTGREAIDLAEQMQFHAAVVDLHIPIGAAADDHPAVDSTSGGGMWLLELIRRLPNRPPVVVLRRPAFSQRQAERMLNQALRLGAFSVMNKPVDIEQLLGVFRRLMDRRYSGAWPSG